MKSWWIFNEPVMSWVMVHVNSLKTALLVYLFTYSNVGTSLDLTFEKIFLISYLQKMLIDYSYIPNLIWF